MKKISATKAKDNFGEVIDTAQREPVEIQRKGRAVAVIVSVEEFKRLEALEDSWWANEAQKALNEGMLGQKESENLLAGLLNAKA
ncbi:MAG: type II toxin-antitoxin system Phd/YefM family antitoxin [Bdellovibrionaceae bacterium]|nr:type II toxin-antitoxin system Phd/YefM family antitoxin [Pseudobdellovibrionaceae bacterium]